MVASVARGVPEGAADRAGPAGRRSLTVSPSILPSPEGMAVPGEAVVMLAVSHGINVITARRAHALPAE